MFIFTDHPGFHGPDFLCIPRNLAKSSERKPLKNSPVFSISIVLRLFSKILEPGDQGRGQKGGKHPQFSQQGSGFRNPWGAR